MYTATQEKKNGKKKVALILGIVLTMSIAIGGIAAYLTYTTNTLTNNFSLNTNLKISLTEPSWVETNAANLAPEQDVAKDPTVTNTGDIEAYVAITYDMPVFTGKVVDTTGKAVAATDADLYTPTINSGWTQVGTATLKTVDGKKYRTYTYVYDTTLVKDATATLFNKITVADLAEGLTDQANQMEITAHAIQKSDAFANATAAFNAYKTQNPDAKGISVSAS